MVREGKLLVATVQTTTWYTPERLPPYGGPAVPVRAPEQHTTVRRRARSLRGTLGT